jgi:hypothetical protein
MISPEPLIADVQMPLFALAVAMPGCSFSLAGKMPNQWRVVRVIGGASLA